MLSDADCGRAVHHVCHSTCIDLQVPGKGTTLAVTVCRYTVQLVGTGIQIGIYNECAEHLPQELDVYIMSEFTLLHNVVQQRKGLIIYLNSWHRVR